jgi:hypothetical protein
VRVRRDRQALLTREDPAQFSFVLSKSALRRVLGGPKVMAGQLRHLAELALLPQVDIQVILSDKLSYVLAQLRLHRAAVRLRLGHRHRLRRAVRRRVLPGEAGNRAPLRRAAAPVARPSP